ncbi:MAG: hypothetical protein K0M40_15180 [Prolixibacteraceae bacterium]|nr:hypothetical protein [Prolixibacteraceae bacterium]
MRNEQTRTESRAWEVPEERDYPEMYSKREQVEFHALEPFFESKNASTPEKTFVSELEKYSEHIDWWYKNGDSGKEHCAVPYKNSMNVDALFYVDFIVRFKTGITALFDTKTKRSDPEAPAKHNALLYYCLRENEKQTDRKLIGSIIVSEEIANVLTWRYSSRKIKDTNDLFSWEYFNPANF